MVEVRLNPKKRDNYAFFDPESRLHLTVTNPGGVIPQVTARIQSAINTGVLILVNKDTTPAVSKPTPDKKVQQKPSPVVHDPETTVENPVEENNSIIEESVAEESVVTDEEIVVEEQPAEANTEAQGEPEQVQEPVAKKGRKSKKEK